MKFVIIIMTKICIVIKDYSTIQFELKHYYCYNHISCINSFFMSCHSDFVRQDHVLVILIQYVSIIGILLYRYCDQFIEVTNECAKYNNNIIINDINLLLPLKFNMKQTVGKLSYFCYLVLTHILSIYRSDEDIEMKVCEPYSLHQSKATDDIYDECQPPVDTSVYESM